MVMNVDWLTIEDWIDYGRTRGWCSEVVCDTHDGTPMTDEEIDEWDSGLDPCLPVLRIW